METPLTTTDIARRFGIPPWMVVRAYQRGLMPEPARVTGKRVVSESELPEIEAALRRAGYLKTPALQTA